MVIKILKLSFTLVLRDTIGFLLSSATGSVINIVNSNHVRCGADYVYYMGPVYGAHGQPNRSTSTYDDEEPVEKTNLIMLLLEANNKVIS